jgi:O-antigen/teichoic acid export membrane protein
MAAAGLISGKKLAKNSIYNLLGQGLPLAIALFSIPMLVKGLGMERFGVLSIAWMFTGYFSLFDFGMGRALSQDLARRIGIGEDGVAETAWTGIVLLFVFGAAAALLILFCSPWLANSVLKISPGLKKESMYSFMILGAAIPFVIVSSGMRGVLEANQRFDITGVIRFLMGLFTYAGPLLVLPFSKRLPDITCSLAVGRVIICAVFAVSCHKVLPALKRKRFFKKETAHSLLRLGGWMTLSNIIGPVMTYMDRFLVGAFLSMTAVAYYTTPYDLVNRLTIISASLTGVLFPAFSASFAKDRDYSAVIFRRGMMVMLSVLFPVCLLLVTYSGAGLTLWLGDGFSRHSYQVLQILTIGVFMNSLATMSFTAIQAAGRPDLTAKIHIVELPLYVLSVIVATKKFGIEGTALAWSIRNGLDMVLLFIVAGKVLPELGPEIKKLNLMFFLAPVALAVCTFSGEFKEIPLAVFSCAYAYCLWLPLRRPHERGYLHGRFRALFSGVKP